MSMDIGARGFWKLVAVAAVLGGLAAPTLAASAEVNIYSFRKEALIRPQLDAFTRATGIEVNLLTGSADGLIERLRGAGYSDGIPVDPHPHRKRAYFHDGGGNEYEFVEYTSDDPAERNASYPS